MKSLKSLAYDYDYQKICAYIFEISVVDKLHLH
jgi:hypothetical protein